MGLEEKVGLKDLFRFRGVTEQLDEGIKDIGSSWAEYRRDIDEVTNKLVEAGYVIKPRGSERSIESILNVKEHQSIILGEVSGLLIEGNKRVLSRTGPLLKTPRRYSLEAGERDRVNVRSLLAAKLRTVRISDFFVGFDFQGAHYANQQYRVVPLVDWVRAHILDDELPDDAVHVSVPTLTPPFVPERGVNFVVRNVPSISGIKPYYDIKIEHVPVYFNKPTAEVNKTSFDIDNNHTCMKTIYDMKLARGLRTGDESLFDFHVILAYLKGKKVFEQKNMGYAVLDLFTEPDSITKQFFWNCLERTLVEYREEGHVKRVPLDLTTVETYLWALIGYRNMKRK